MTILRLSGLGFIFTLLFSIESVAATLWQTEGVSSRVDINNSKDIHYFTSNESELRNLLDLTPQEHSGQSLEISLPMPDGSLARFKAVESSIMEVDLAVKYPGIKSYKVYGIDDPFASGRVDISPKGFRGMLNTSNGRVFIDPDNSSPTSGRYASRNSDALDVSNQFQCGTYELPDQHLSSLLSASRPAARIAGSLLQYRLAVSATQEYVIAVGGDINNEAAAKITVMAEINTAINRVNQIYERDFGIRLVLVGNNDDLIDVTNVSDLAGFNSNGIALLSENQSWVDSQILDANYDIGHVFSTGGGGIARLQSVCESGSKAAGVTGLPNPTGDTFYIDYVAHEIGHQFGADHTFNGTTSSCGPNRSPGGRASFEPGSGSTIMSYAGICGAEDIQSGSDATFHAGSIDQVNAFVSTAATCNTLVTASNPNDPMSDAGIDRNIPRGTPFLLDGSGTDADLDTLSYQWDQMDNGTATSANTFGDDLQNNALFRTYEPSSVAGRHFPALGTQVDGQSDLSESLPCTARDLNFRLTVRDGMSGQDTDNIVLTVDRNSGPFGISSHNTAQTILVSDGPVTLQWAVANTTNAPVSCPNVDIDLLTFSGDQSTYAVTSLEVGTPNDGSSAITIPDFSATNARFRVSCANNIFYDISDAELAIQGGGGNFATTGNQTVFNTNGAVFAAKGEECAVKPKLGANILGNGTPGGGSGAIDFFWLFSPLSIVFIRRFLRGFSNLN